MRKSQRAYQAEAEAVKMCKDIALTTGVDVLQPGPSQRTLLLQDGESASRYGDRKITNHLRLNELPNIAYVKHNLQKYT